MTVTRNLLFCSLFIWPSNTIICNVFHPVWFSYYTTTSLVHVCYSLYIVSHLSEFDTLHKRYPHILTLHLNVTDQKSCSDFSSFCECHNGHLFIALGIVCIFSNIQVRCSPIVQPIINYYTDRKRQKHLCL